MRQDLAVKERRRLAEAFPGLTLDTSKVPVTVTGIMRLYAGMGFSVHLEIPCNYPRGIPTMRCNPKEIPWQIDRHVDPDTGLACLCVTSEYRKHWPLGSDLMDFLGAVVHPYLVGQAYYQDHDHWPTGHERSHGTAGIIEAYEELLTPMGPVSYSVVLHFMQLLARPTDPKGHEACPCESGRRLRNCHQSLLVELRQTIDPAHAQQDRKLLLASSRTRTSLSDIPGIIGSEMEELADDTRH